MRRKAWLLALLPVLLWVLGVYSYARAIGG